MGSATLYDRDGNAITITDAQWDGGGHNDKVTYFGTTADRFTAALQAFVVSASAAFIANSTDSLTIGTGSKSLTVEENKPFFVGSYVRIEEDGTPSNYMAGDVTAYDPGTGSMTVNVTQTGGSGTISDWKLLAQGRPGADIDWQGAWDSNTVYSAQQAVSHNNASWIAPNGADAGDEPGVSAKWDQLASAGDVLTVNGQTGDVSLTTGVSSVNSKTGDVTVPTPPVVRNFVATGTINTGDVVALRSDGTVEVVQEITFTDGVEDTTVFEGTNTLNISATYDSKNAKVVIAYRDSGGSNYGNAVVGTVSNGVISFGTPVVFESATAKQMSVTYDTSNGKVVVAYRDNGNSDRGTAIVGEVSGDSINFGTAVVFENGLTRNTSAVYDSAARKVVIAYQDFDDSKKGKAVVGTVSGNSISFGTSIVFNSASTVHIATTYDAFAEKVVIAYQDDGNSDFGTAVVGTALGDSISFGTSVVFESAAIIGTSIAFDSGAGRVVIAYRDDGNNLYGTVVVGTVSGDSISFGTPVVFNTATTFWMSLIYDKPAGKIVIFYEDGGNSDYGTAIAGTVSGNSISFDAPVVFGSTEVAYTSATYDKVSEKVVVAYQDSGNSEFGTAALWQTGYLGTNADDWIGVSQATLNDAETGQMMLRGGVDTNQSGLTPPNILYLNGDGTFLLGNNGRKLGRVLASDTILLAAE